ncbi:MAG: hypothetical protein J7L96_01115 [Bacteroidales bacterium]|nr:hypothetical protein [Bacteroidales bacterium]
MDYQAKHSAYNELKGAEFLEKDLALLEKLKPSSKALRNLSNPDKGKVQQEILWDLLEYADPKEIIKNRGNKKPTSPPDPFKGKTPEKVLEETDLKADLEYYFVKQLVKALKLEVPNQKRGTLVGVLLKYKEDTLSKDPDETDKTTDETENENPDTQQYPPDIENKNPDSPVTSGTESGEGEKNPEEDTAEGTGVSENPVGES